MKVWYWRQITFVFVIIGSVYLQAATSPPSSEKNLKQNFVVPDAPAFLLLGMKSDSASTASTSFLRPSTVREVAIAASDFVSNGSFVLPSSFAAEIAPFVIADNTLNRTYPSILEQIRISIGTHRPANSSNATQLAVGLRMTLLNDADLRNDTTLQKKLDSLNQTVTSGVIAGGRPTDASRGVISTTNSAAQEQDIAAYVERLQDSSWNKSCLEIAFAGRGSSPDSLGKNLRFDNVSAWLTWAWKTGKTSQLFVGANFSYSKNVATDSAFSSVFTVGTRFYVGSNYYKGYAIAEGQAKKNDSRFTLGIGIEIKIYDSIWADYTAGIQASELTHSSHTLSSFRLKYGL